MKTSNELNTLLYTLLADLHATERLIAEHMPALVELAEHRSVKHALEHHHNLSGNQVKRLDEILKSINNTPGDGELPAVAALVDSAKQLSGNVSAGNLKDAVLIAALERLEYYEISSYQTAISYATVMENTRIVNLLTETLDEEKEAADLLNELGKSIVHIAYEASPKNEKAEEVANTTSETEVQKAAKVSISERTINSPGGRAGTSHRGYNTGESRGH